LSLFFSLLFHFSYIAEALNTSFPGVLVIPSIGNNDVYPDYNITCNDPKLLYLHDAYSSWIPSDQVNTFLQMGAFAVSPLPSLLILSLNTILYSGRNTNVMNASDPCGQFAWLSGQLENAKNSGVAVYIIGHIIPGMDPDYYTPLWVSSYIATFLEIVIPYTSGVIEGMLFGHVHRDEFRMLNIPQQTNVISSLVTASSFTPIFDNNPSFRLYKYNKDYTLSDYQSFYIDLYLANVYGQANWTLEYSWSDYGEGQLGTSSLSAFLSSMQKDPALFAQWFDRRVALAELTQQAALCVVLAPDTPDFNTCMGQATKK